MKKRTRIMRAALALVVGAALLPMRAARAEMPAPSDLSATEAPPPATPASATTPAAPPRAPRRDQANVRGVSPFIEACVEGNRALAAHAVATAIEAYERAVRFEPRDPRGYYLLGQAHETANDPDHAEAALALALTFVPAKDHGLRARILLCLAQVREKRGSWKEALAAYQAYADLAHGGNDEMLFPASAAARAKAIEDALDRASADAIVKARAYANAVGAVIADPQAVP